jgi:hypothetical protein
VARFVGIVANFSLNPCIVFRVSLLWQESLGDPFFFEKKQQVSTTSTTNTTTSSAKKTVLIRFQL